MKYSAAQAQGNLQTRGPQCSHRVLREAKNIVASYLEPPDTHEPRPDPDLLLPRDDMIPSAAFVKNESISPQVRHTRFFHTLFWINSKHLPRFLGTDYAIRKHMDDTKLDR